MTNRYGKPSTPRVGESWKPSRPGSPPHDAAAVAAAADADDDDDVDDDNDEYEYEYEYDDDDECHFIF